MEPGGQQALWFSCLYLLIVLKLLIHLTTRALYVGTVNLGPYAYATSTPTHQVISPDPYTRNFSMLRDSISN